MTLTTVILPYSPGEPHTVGNADCDAGWCGGWNYPRRCESTDDCTGLVHAAFGDENKDDDYWLFTKCDVCGENDRR